VASILFVGDEISTQQALARLLTDEGFTVEVRSDEKGALDYLAESLPSVIVLDLRAPRSSGKDRYERIRAWAPLVPIIIVSEVSDARDKALLLELGADDYVSKPFSQQEFLARVRVALRRTELRHSDDSVSFDGVVVDFNNAQVSRDGVPVELTAGEFKLLHYLIRNADRVITRAELLRHVCGYSAEIESRTIDTRVFSLRQRLEKDPHNPTHILTVQTVGYRFKLKP